MKIKARAGLYLAAAVFSTALRADCLGGAMEEKAAKLPPPRLKGAVSVEETLAVRRSARAFAEKDLTAEQLGQLLWAAQGVTLKKAGLRLRTAPSAGALYPLDAYAVKKDGVFAYLPAGHELRRIAVGDRRRELAAASLGQDSLASAPLTIVLCAVYPRVTAKYGERGVRYAHIEAGHIAQNVHLQAVAAGLGSVPIGAFDGTGVAKALNLPAGCEPVYLVPVGFPAGK